MSGFQLLAEDLRQPCGDRFVKNLWPIGVEAQADRDVGQSPACFTIVDPTILPKSLNPMDQKSTLATAGRRRQDKARRRLGIAEPTIEEIEFPVTTTKRNCARTFLSDPILC
jgi:hypothetical protein